MVRALGRQSDMEMQQPVTSTELESASSQQGACIISLISLCLQLDFPVPLHLDQIMK